MVLYRATLLSPSSSICFLSYLFFLSSSFFFFVRCRIAMYALSKLLRDENADMVPELLQYLSSNIDQGMPDVLQTVSLKCACFRVLGVVINLTLQPQDAQTV